MTCSHTEARISDGRRGPDRHDCAYVDRRVALIPRAEAIADEAAGEAPQGDIQHARWSNAWNRAFHAAMDRLSADGEAKHVELGKQAQTEIAGAMRRWRRKGLTLAEASTVLRNVREAI